MIDGTYAVEVDTPLGRKSGKIKLKTKGSVLTTSFKIPVFGKQKVEGTVDGDSFSAEGTLKARLMGSVDYRVEGQVIGDDISATIHTSMGSLEAVGVRVA